MLDMLNHIDPAAAINAINSWGKEYWAFILVLATVSYFVTNFVHNVRASLRNARERRLDRLTQLVRSGRPYMTYAHNFVPRTNLSNVLKRSSDMEMVNAIGRSRLNRMNDLRGQMRSE